MDGVGDDGVHVANAHPSVPSASCTAFKPRKKIDPVSGNMVVENMQNDTNSSNVSWQRSHWSAGGKVDRFDC